MYRQEKILASQTSPTRFPHTPPRPPPPSLFLWFVPDWLKTSMSLYFNIQLISLITMLTILKSVTSCLRTIHLKKKLLRENTIYNFFPLEKIHLIKKKIIRIRNILFRWKKKKETIFIYCWFSRDVTKIQTTKLSILLRFYFHGVLEQLKTNFQTNFRFKRVLGFVIEYAWISKLLCDAAFAWRPRELSFRLKKWLFSSIRKSITLMFMSSSRSKSTPL